MAKNLDMVKGPHFLYRASVGGKETWGIRVRVLGSESEVEELGYSREFNLNDVSLKVRRSTYRERLGFSNDEYDSILNDVQEQIA